MALAAVSMVAAIACGALAVDLAMAFAARAGAQRAADSAALAGASTFLDYSHDDPRVVDTATARALDFATSNDILHDPIAESQVTVWVVPESQLVRVRVTATGLPVWFAPILNVFSMDVGAIAAAVASDAGVAAAQCLLPFAMPDLWEDMDDDNATDPANRIPDGGEQWFFENARERSESAIPDRYAPYAEDDPDATGFGSSFRDGVPSLDDGRARVGDYGRRIVLKAQPREGGPAPGGSPGGGWTPATTGEIAPGNFQMWTLPDPATGCGPGEGSAKWVWWNIDNCNTCPISLATDYPIRTGDVESIKHPLSRLYARDPGAHWVDDLTGGHIESPNFDNPEEESPLVRVVAIFSPEQNFHGSTVNIQFINFAKVFIEPGNPEGAVYGRFLGPVSGSGPGVRTGSLVKYLRLVE